MAAAVGASAVRRQGVEPARAFGPRGFNASQRPALTPRAGTSANETSAAKSYSSSLVPLVGVAMSDDAGGPKLVAVLERRLRGPTPQSSPDRSPRPNCRADRPKNQNSKSCPIWASSRVGPM